MEEAIEEHARFAEYVLEMPLLLKGTALVLLGMALLPGILNNLRSASALAVSMLIFGGVLFSEFRHIDELRLPARALSTFAGPLVATYGVLAYALLTYLHPAW
ncbi:hypothetical protein [Thiomonas sp.]